MTAPGATAPWADDARSDAPAGTSGPAAPSDAVKRATAGVFSDLPFSAPTTLAGWVATVGLFIAGFAILLPWRATPGLPYLMVWGAAQAAVVVAAILAFVFGLLAISPSRLAPRVRWGYLPFFGGAFGLGVAWIWQSAYAADVGLWAYVLGSVIAGVGGALSLSGWAEPTT
ncbi:MAG TPA: hypothetical protein VFW92_06210 [Candidatus Limnocylindrales bacterium]|jgi:hypothetical protein|nr:hypothetical protein [Candidatus Limnocylindrales bacterium]